MTVHALLTTARGQATVTPITAQALLAHVTGRGRAWLLAHGEEAISAEQSDRFKALLDRAARGEPLAYLVGEKEFCGLAFAVTPDTLIPRPETEALVEEALAWAATARTSAPRLVDAGTGSGAVAVTLAVKLPQARVVAVDVSPGALAVARANAERHGVARRIAFLRADLLGALSGPFEAILANLPYIPSAALAGLDTARWEPRLALDGGADGLSLIRQLVRQASTRLAAGGLLALEIQADQGQRVAALCRAAFPAGAVSIQRDLAGLERIVTAQDSTDKTGAVE